jgi:chitodextrinase
MLGLTWVWAAQAAAADPVIFAAGDIACAPGDPVTSTTCHERYTSDTILSGGAARALALGDLQYNSASLSNLQNSYDKTWGRFKSITRPVLGNHESTGTGYFDYFNGSGVNNGPAGERGKGYYSYDVGAWHLIALNPNCSRVPCSAGSAQEQWLRADLASHPNTCTLAYWHHPRFSSGHDGDGTFMQPIWQALYDADADVVLVGHSHDYERFAPQNASGGLDRTRGIREFVVGTGGAFFTGLSTTKPNSEVRQNKTFGVLRLTLHSTSYDWQFVPEAGKTWTDSGSDSCHGAGGSPPPDTEVPTAPTGLTATAPSPTRVDLNWNGSSDNVAVSGYEIYRNGAFLANSPGTTYADTTASPGTTYSYQVRARDAAGNSSEFSNTATVTTPTSTGTDLTFAPQADARVEEASPNTNFGTSTKLRNDGGADPDIETYLTFGVSGAQGPVQSAKLRLYAYSGTANGPAVYSTSSAWSESGTTGITWANRPPPSSTARDDKAAIATNSWVEYDVTPFVTGNGTYSFLLATNSTDGIDMYSREATSLRPELVVKVGEGPAPVPDTEPPTAPTNLNATASSASRVDLNWSASSDNVAVAGYEVYRDGALLGNATGTTYADTTTSPGTTYSYQVRARDAVGNPSEFSNAATATTPASTGSSLIFAPQADARVEEASPSTNYGTSSKIRADGGSGPDVESYLTFTVGGALGPVQSARLRLHFYTGTVDGPAVYSTSSAWVESGPTGITWATRPPPTSAAADDKGAIADGTWVEYDVTQFVTGNGTYSFRLATTSSDGVDIYSREATSLRPELVLSVG